MGNRTAAAGTVYVCVACGKRSRDLYGDQAISGGWDESCVLNAVLCEEVSLVFAEGSSRVVKADAVKLTAEEEAAELEELERECEAAFDDDLDDEDADAGDLEERFDRAIAAAEREEKSDGE